MLKEFIDRENEIFSILDRLRNNKIDFILIGGYAISAFQHRFSVDADIVIKENQLNKIKEILEKNNFEPYKSMDLENIYQGKFRAFIKKTELPITVDLLINAVSSRQTNASWSFESFKNNSIEKEIKGIEKTIIATLPIKELLIATKIHSCRLTDIRDIVAICDKINIDKMVEFTIRGDFPKLKQCISRFKETIKNKNFIDAFKGVFSLDKFPSNNIKFSEEIINKLEDAINKSQNKNLKQSTTKP